MIEVTVYADGVPAGHAKLIAGDPPMGVSAGIFEPLPAYGAFRDTVTLRRAHPEIVDPQTRPVALRVWEKAGDLVECAFAEVEDFSEDSQDGGRLTLTVYGTPHAAYRRYFGQDPAYLSYYLGSRA